MRFNKNLPNKKNELHPYSLLHSELDDLFQNFFSDWSLEPVNGLKRLEEFRPSINIDETEKEYLIRAELPGVDEKDVELTVSKDAITIKGEKKEENKEEKKNRHYYECNYGSFSRTIPLPEGVDTSKTDAKYKKGVLKITLPKAPESKDVKKLSIQSEE